jgi:hypothetical protein
MAASMGLWEGVDTGQLLPKVSPGPAGCHAQPFYTLRVGHPRNGLTAVSGMAHPQIGWPAAVFYPFGHPIPYAYGSQ